MSADIMNAPELQEEMDIALVVEHAMGIVRDFCANCGFLRPVIPEPDKTMVCGDCYTERMA
jgi:hypothetical protein